MENLETIASAVPPGSKVYKDDCMYSFDTPEGPRGLDVCFSCYQAYSRSDINYTRQHFEASGHALYLNIRQTLKPAAERAPRGDDGEASPKMAKLEIKDESPEDLYDFAYQVYDAASDKSIELGDAPAKLQQLAHSILDYNSSNRDEEIKAWEQEITACEHSIEVQQVGTERPDLSRCTQCDLTENLWICLHCGALGCGRAQFGSKTPGNSHALAHFEASDHPVAVKLGSLSATDKESYDAYCYRCNDEVKVPDLVADLQKYGIDLDKSVKTEKSLAELNLDQNMSWQFGLDGEDQEPVFGANFTGLANLGNSCYINSVVQALFHLDPYVRHFADKTFPAYDQLPNPASDLFSQLLKLHHGLTSGKYSRPNPLKGDEYQTGLRLVMLKALIGRDHSEFSTNKQQDAFEFMLYLLEQLDKQLGPALNTPLKFALTNRILCSSCLKGKAADELVDSIAVDVEDEVASVEDGKKTYKPVDLLDSFRAYCEDEVIDGYKCDHCSQTTEGIKSSGFKSFPDYLVVNAKRIKLDNWVPIKVDVPITIGDTIDLGGFAVEPNDQYEYASEAKFTPDQSSLDTLLGMGFPENRAIKALSKTGNSSAEVAMNWLFEHMEDADIDAPLEQSSESVVDEAAVANLASMGFSAALSKKALVVSGGDPNAAVEWLFSHPDDDGKLEQQPDAKAQQAELLDRVSQSKNSGKYRLKVAICHKGTSPHTGHYVAFIRVDGQWTLFNDEKVVKCSQDNLDDISVNGYVYIFESVYRHVHTDQ